MCVIIDYYKELSLFDAILPSIGTRVMKCFYHELKRVTGLRKARASDGYSNSHAFPDLTLCDDFLISRSHF